MANELKLEIFYAEFDSEIVIEMTFLAYFPLCYRVWQCS